MDIPKRFDDGMRRPLVLEEPFHSMEASMSTDLSGQTALVTGSTSGIGRATAEHLAARGAHVLVSGRDAERGDAVVAAIRAAGGKADFIAADLHDATAARDLARRATDLGGGAVDILVNNAGIFPFQPTVDITEETFDAVIAVNVKAAFFLVAALAPAMAARGHGAIVNVSSMAASLGMPVTSLYGSSKLILEGMTRCWATEFGPAGVRVNAVSPGPIRTEGTEPFGPALDDLVGAAPAGRVGTPAEVAAAIGFLVGPDAGYIQGTVLAVDGGRTAV
jgi:NAD(P)-dependent dehydrogenase (short-subunit alcohol dehydrogenase family)